MKTHLRNVEAQVEDHPNSPHYIRAVERGTVTMCRAITDSDHITEDKDEVDCWACHDTWEFNFTNTLGVRETYLMENVLSIHSPATDDMASLIKVRNEDGEISYTGSLHHTNELINKFNRFAPEEQKLIRWKYNDHIKHHATKRAEMEMYENAKKNT